MTDELVPEPAQDFTLSKTCEETLPPPHRSPSPPPAVRPKNYIGIIPTSQAKRKHDFELVIEVPSKKFKPPCYLPPSASSGSPAASSGRSVPEKSVTTTTRPVRECQTRFRNFHKITGTRFKVALDPQVRDATVTRDFLRAHFGTHSTASFCQLPAHQVDRHGYDHFVFASEVNSCSLLTSVPG